LEAAGFATAAPPLPTSTFPEATDPPSRSFFNKPDKCPDEPGGLVIMLVSQVR